MRLAEGEFRSDYGRRLRGVLGRKGDEGDRQDREQGGIIQQSEDRDVAEEVERRDDQHGQGAGTPFEMTRDALVAEHWEDPEQRRLGAGERAEELHAVCYPGGPAKLRASGREEPGMSTQFLATAFATAITIIDPIGMIPLTLSATAHASPERRNRIVDQAVLVAAGIMLFMGLVGQALLSYLGITLPAFLIAGGILLFLIAIDMLFARPTGAKGTEEEEREAAQVQNPAVFPLAVPMIAGPGTIATVLLLLNLTKGDRFEVVIVFGAYAAALLITWLCMRGATLLQRYVGRTGIHVVTRLLGIILAALAVQFVLNGLVQTPLLHAH